MQTPPPPRRPLLTQIAHQHLRETVQAWQAAHPAGTPRLAIDATAGNGHDTVFLAALLGAGGEVAAFDIQPQALAATAARLRAHAASATLPALAKVRLIDASHAEMLDALPPQWRGAVCAATFNLGYLPGGDKTCVTLAESTLVALEATLQLLAPGGLLSVLCYRGHAEGGTETAAIRNWLATLPACYSQQWIHAAADAPPHAPLLLHIRRKLA